LNILVFVAKRGPLPASDVARRLNMEKSTVSRTTHRMRDHGWLTVVGDGRLLTLTRKGKAVIEEAVPAWKAAQARAQTVLGEDGAASIHSLNDAVRSHNVRT
jgi:DNA-binding MarR family transcriptional regulator